jgi:hypothetical protein
MNNRELHYFIGICLAAEQNPELKEKIVGQVLGKHINWKRFVLICSNNLVLQTIYVKFRDLDILKLLPHDLSNYLKEIYTLNLQRNQEILEQIDEIITNLNARNIHPIFIKGAGNLIDRLYKDMGERILADIDLLVSEEYFLPAAKCLEDLGYKNSHPLYETYSQLMHYPSLERDDLPAEVEIHRSPVMLRWSGKFNNLIVERDKKSVAGKEGCSVPSDQHKVIINFIHSQLSNKGSITGLVSFRDLYDLFLLAGRIDLNILLKEIPYKGRAISYFRLASGLFDMRDELYPIKTITSRIYLLHYHLNLSSRIYYHIYRVMRSFLELVFVDYLGKIPRLVFDGKMRKTILRKLKSKEWYRTHLRSYWQRFS